MTEPLIAQRAPYGVEVEAGRTYFWCACGKSSNQPFCDGSHQGGTLAPTPFTPAQSGKVWLCGCKHSGNGVYCDGTHKTLP